MSEADFRKTFDSVISGIRELSDAIDDDGVEIAGVLSLNEYMLFTSLVKELNFWSYYDSSSSLLLRVLGRGFLPLGRPCSSVRCRPSCKGFCRFCFVRN